MTDQKTQPIKVAIAAMGGQGGGVLSAWLVALAESNNYFAQYTSVPGVAQRTGATIYYVELFPEALSVEAGKDPVMSLMPAAGDVDVVVAGELVEAGRAISRGIVTPEQTTLIASTHRLYSQSEKQILGDGRADADLLMDASGEHAKHFIGFDMNQMANDTRCMISAVLYGSLAGSGRLPFTREQFENVIREGGKAVESNLAGFAAGYDMAQDILNDKVAKADEQTAYAMPTSKNTELQAILDQVKADIPAQAHQFAVEGIKRLIDYQDVKYAKQYLATLTDMVQHDKSLNGSDHDFMLSKETARHLALWMSYEDTARVADLKTRKTRFNRYKSHVRAKQTDVAHVVEFMHPRVEEIADTMPAWLGSMIMNVKPLRGFVNLFCKERKMHTSTLSGFLVLYMTAKCRGIRRSSLRFKRESQRINEWLGLVKQTASNDYDGGVGVAQCQRLIKGYGDTFDHGWENYNKIIDTLPKVMKGDKPGNVLESLRDAALADETGTQLHAAFVSNGVA